MTSVPVLRRAVSFGTGVGIRLGETTLEIAVVRVRPSGARLAGVHRIDGFRDKPAAEWGAAALAFLKTHGAERQAAIAVLARPDAILRLITLPGVNDEDTAAAVRFQLDSLHPFTEDEVAHGWQRLNQTQVAVGITEQRHIDTTAALLSEAGIRLAGISFSGPVLHAALRATGTPPSALLASWPGEAEGLEFYGESPARPLYSAEFDLPPDRAAGLVRAELRLDGDPDCLSLEQLLPWPAPDPGESGPTAPTTLLAQAGALAAACPHLGEPLNLLPLDQRASSSRARYIPTLVLATLLAVTGGALLAQEAWLDRQYLARLQAEIGNVEPAVARVQKLDEETAALAARIRQLDDFRRQSRADLDAVKEVNRLLPPPAWVQQLQIGRDTLQVAGEAAAAEGLLKQFDEAPAFRGATFTMPLNRGQNGELFRIRVQREGAAQ
ncbi:MAG: hypothetical protein M9913_17525 [Bryobacteraceae bacterium]|nr:hypothetical protein [Solibacteraceae bacterium]MCL4843358.1 hypothetical protein [Bryobacteraceae bacterium]MCO5352667.1 hypothetical protein [Bryobacteraceae bacterium]